MNKKRILQIAAIISLIAGIAGFFAWEKAMQRQNYLRIMIVHRFISASIDQHILENKSIPASWNNISHWPENGIFKDENYLPYSFIRQNVGFLPGIKPSSTNEMEDVRLWLSHYGSNKKRGFSYSIDKNEYNVPVLWFFHKVPFKGLCVSFTDLDDRATVSYQEFGEYLKAAFLYAEMNGIDYDKSQIDYWEKRRNDSY